MVIEFKKRRTAFKIPIGLIAKGTIKLEKNPDDPTKERFNFFGFENKEINRINMIATVIDKYESNEKNFASLTIDDGTGTMRVRAFSDSIALIKEVSLGSTILIIGTLRYFNNELYILPEIIKQLDPRWLLARKLELEKELPIYKELRSSIQTTQSVQQTQSQPVQQAQAETTQQTPEPEEITTEKIADETDKAENNHEKPCIRDEILQLIKDAETEQGIDIDKVIMQLKHQPVEKIKNSITELLEGGEIFEPQPGRLRIL